MFENLKHLFDFKHWLDIGAIPFILATGNDIPRMNWTRIIESLLIAGITAATSVYATIQVNKNDIKYLVAQMSQLSKDVKSIGLEQSRRRPLTDWVQREIERRSDSK